MQSIWMRKPIWELELNAAFILVAESIWSDAFSKSIFYSQIKCTKSYWCSNCKQILIITNVQQMFIIFYLLFYQNEVQWWKIRIKLNWIYSYKRNTSQGRLGSLLDVLIYTVHSYMPFCFGWSPKHLMNILDSYRNHWHNFWVFPQFRQKSHVIHQAKQIQVTFNTAQKPK